MNDVIFSMFFPKYSPFNFYLIAFDRIFNSPHFAECANIADIAEIFWQKTAILPLLYIDTVPEKT